MVSLSQISWIRWSRLSSNNISKVFSKSWYVGEDELRYYVEHYRKGAKKQLGESQLTKSQRYQDYKLEVADALNPLLYKKQIKEAYTS